MKLVHYNPLNDLSVFKETFDNFFNDSLLKPRESQIWKPPVDIMEQENSVLLTIELPGLSKEDINIDIEDNIMTITGERKQSNEEKEITYYRKERIFGKFQRTFTLSNDIITDNVDAKFNEGILTITLQKDKQKESVKRITIQ